MDRCIAYEGYYKADWETGGRSVVQDVKEFVILANYGLVHYKIILNPGGRVVVFTDLDSTTCLRHFGGPKDNEALERHRQFGRMKRTVTKAGGAFSRSVYADCLSILRLMAKDIAINEKAMSAWRTVTGEVVGASYADIAGRAENIVAEQRQIHLHQHALVMASTDPTWGMF